MEPNYPNLYVADATYQNLKWTTPADIEKGEVVTIGSFITFAFAKANADESVTMVTKSPHVTTYVKRTPEIWTPGIYIYYDVAAVEVTIDDESGANLKIGTTVDDVAADETKATFNFNGEQ